ncbi:Kinesin-13 4, putative [Leishmania guyanensis]|uniref:Kinesin-like protein n=1 Tax=Leishmania guyanensis TaxID=5670 RepID=A0A1E1J2J1_LEIGU|nr:mitotic centromere-associated kinesin (MCAK),putative [Leishmania guyanensis]
MDAAREGNSWASKAEAEAQQLRRFVHGADHHIHFTPPPLPRLAALNDKTVPPSSVQMPFALTTCGDAARRGSRDDSVAGQRSFLKGAAIPSVSTLNRELDSLSLQFAEMCGDGSSGVVVGSSMATSTLKLSNEPRQASTPGVSRVTPHDYRCHSNAPFTPPPLEVHAPLQVNKSPCVAAEISGEKDCASPVPRTTVSADDGANTSSPLPLKREDRTASEPSTRFSNAAGAARTSPVGNGRCKGRDGRITVVVRKRPLAPGECGVDCVQVDNAHVRIAVTKQRVDLTSYEENSDYVFDAAFGAEATNEDVYLNSVKELLTVSLSGGSASCFAYGQTGSGKTYTMIGTETEKGLYLQAAADLFERLKPGQQLCVSFFEIYCNALYDLLNHRHPIILREGANRRVNICGVMWRTVEGVEELWQLVQAGIEQRRTGTTTANEHSSRSHAVLSLHIKDCGCVGFTGTVNFVDLAGSERAADTAAHDRLTRLEGAEINKSLLALKECIRALDEKKKHVPFRGSRLTEVLRDSFTGNSKTVMIAAVSSSSLNHEHTNNTLRYAFRVKGLSIASVEPSKARNAPRHHQPVSRSRSSVPAAAAANEPTSISAMADYDSDSKHTDGPRFPRKPRRTRKRRHDRKKTHRSKSRIGIVDADASIAMSDTTTESLETALQGAQRAQARQVRRNSTGSSIPLAHKKISALLPDATELQPWSRERRRTPRSSSPLPHAVRSIYESSDFFLTRASDKDAKSRALAEVTLPKVKGATLRPSPLTPVDVTALEQRLTLQIIAQLRLDLGRQLEQVLTEKDTMIVALQSENLRLRQALTSTHKDEPWCTSSSCDVDVRQRPGLLPPLPYPSSPSILQEQLSSGVSTASVVEETLFRVLPE